MYFLNIFITITYLFITLHNTIVYFFYCKLNDRSCNCSIHAVRKNYTLMMTYTIIGSVSTNRIFITLFSSLKKCNWVVDDRFVFTEIIYNYLTINVMTMSSVSDREKKSIHVFRIIHIISAM